MTLDSIRMPFLYPEANKVFVIADVYWKSKRGSSSKIYILDFTEHIEGLIDKIHRLHSPLGGKNLRIVIIPKYTELINTIREYLRENIPKHPALKSYSGRIRSIQPLFFIMKFELGHKIVNIFIDLNELPRDIDDIPVAWRTISSFSREGIEIYCIIIGSINVAQKYLARERSEEEEEIGYTIRGIVCPLTQIVRRTNDREYINYTKKVCKAVRRCLKEEERMARKDPSSAGVFLGSDKLKYVLSSRSAIKYYIHEKPSSKKPYIIPGNIPVKITTIDIFLILIGFTLINRRSNDIIGTFKYHEDFRFETSITNTKAVRFRVNAISLLFHLLYYLFKDPYLRYVTLLKYLLLRKAGGRIPDPSSATILTQSLSISKLSKILTSYLNDPDKLVEELRDLESKISDLIVNDEFFLRFLKILALHTFAHVIYLSVLNALNLDSSEIGLVLDRIYTEKRESEEVLQASPFNIFLKPEYYDIYIYEKADGGLNYLNMEEYSLIHEKIMPTLKKMYDIFKILDKRSINYRDEVKKLYYESSKKAIMSYENKDLNNIINSLEKLSKKMKEINSSIKNYTIIPTWLIRYGYGRELIKIDEDIRRRVKSALLTLITGLYDLYWDASLNDLVLDTECVYYDLIQHFTLSRIYAEYLIEDILKTLKSGRPIMSPLTTDLGKVFKEVRDSEIHIFFSPWIDEYGKAIIQSVIERPKTKEVIIVIREEEKDILKDFTEKGEKVKIISLKNIITEHPLHGKLYVNSSGEIIISSANLQATSLKRNIEDYMYSIDHIIARSIIALITTIITHIHS